LNTHLISLKILHFFSTVNLFTVNLNIGELIASELICGELNIGELNVDSPLKWGDIFQVDLNLIFEKKSTIEKTNAVA